MDATKKPTGTKNTVASAPKNPADKSSTTSKPSKNPFEDEGRSPTPPPASGRASTPPPKNPFSPGGFSTAPTRKKRDSLDPSNPPPSTEAKVISEPQPPTTLKTKDKKESGPKEIEKVHGEERDMVQRKDDKLNEDALAHNKTSKNLQSNIKTSTNGYDGEDTANSTPLSKTTTSHSEDSSTEEKQEAVTKDAKAKKEANETKPVKEVKEMSASMMASCKAAVLKETLVKINYDPALFLDPIIRSVEGKENPEKELLVILNDTLGTLSVLAKEVEEEVHCTEDAVKIQDAMLGDDLSLHNERLMKIKESVDEVREKLTKATSGAIAIGERLEKTERERKRIQKALIAMKHIKLFEGIPQIKYANLHSCNSEQLRAALPEEFQKMTWGEVSLILYELRRILFDINADDVISAQNNVMSLTEAIETELLGEFEVAVIDLMDDQNNAALIAHTKELSTWLHYYNNGQSLQKRYVFSVVERRIPKYSVSNNTTGSDEKGGGSFDKVKKIVGLAAAEAGAKIKGGIPGRRRQRQSVLDESGASGAGNDDDSSEGASDEEVQPPPRPVGKDNVGVNNNGGSASRAKGGVEKVEDHLSELFGSVGAVCQEQFSIIRKIFPPTSVARITRLLIQRIFNDPAFGIQSRVDAVLCPKPPLPQLNLSEYLDALTTVREKLSALHMVLLDYCMHPAMHLTGFSSDYGSLAFSNTFDRLVTTNIDTSDKDAEGNDNDNLINDGMGGNNKSGVKESEVTVLSGAETHQRLKSYAEVKEFLDDQVSQVLSAYIIDYFDKEMANLKFLYNDALKRAVDADPNLIVKVSVLSTLPRLRAEKMKSMEHMVKTVANPRFIGSIFSTSTETITRMESIGRDDKKLPERVKDLFMLQLEYLVDGLFLPLSQACTTMLLKVAATRPQSSTLPPMEFLGVLSTLYSGVSRLKTHFEEVYVKPLSSQPNLILVCKEARRNALRVLESSAKCALHAWTLCIAQHVEKTLYCLQSKYDFSPKLEQLQQTIGTNAVGNELNKTFNKLADDIATNLASAGLAQKPQAISSTAACSAVCKAMLIVSNNVRSHQGDLVGLNLLDSFWRPLGQQFVGSLISHLRKTKVSIEGGRVLLKDLEEYMNVTAIMEAPETMDMLLCLKEIAQVFRASPEKVLKVVVEDLRHLDTAIVLAMVAARSDFGNNRSSNHWTKQLNDSYGSIKWDAPLSWENKKHTSVVAFNQSVSSNNGKPDTSIGPITIRKSSGPLSTLFMMEAARAQGAILPTGSGLGTGLGGGGNGVNRVMGKSSAADPDNGSRFSTQFAPNRPTTSAPEKPSDVNVLNRLANNFSLLTSRSSETTPAPAPAPTMNAPPSSHSNSQNVSNKPTPANVSATASNQDQPTRKASMTPMTTQADSVPPLKKGTSSNPTSSTSSTSSASSSSSTLPSASDNKNSDTNNRQVRSRTPPPSTPAQEEKPRAKTPTKSNNPPKEKERESISTTFSRFFLG